MSDAAEIADMLRGPRMGRALISGDDSDYAIVLAGIAADTIEELQARIKDLDEAACELLTGWDSLVAANAELQRRIDAALFLILKTQRLNLMDYQKNEIVAVLTAEEKKR